MSEKPEVIPDDPRQPEPVRQRYRIVVERAQANYAAISKRLGPREHEFVLRIRAITFGSQDQFARMRALRQLADEYTEYVGDNTACRRGCAHCCHCAVGVTKTEAELIGTEIKRAPLNAPRRASDHAGDFVDFDWGYHNPCAFLKNGECSIYEHRPIVCRVHFNLDNDDLLCRLNPPLGTTVVWLDTSHFRDAAIIIGGGHIADIRDFFPVRPASTYI